MKDHYQQRGTGRYELYADETAQSAMLWHHDCACGFSCPTPALPLQPPVSQPNTPLLRHAVYASLPLQADYRVVCVPSISHVAVVNNATFQVLCQQDYGYRSPTFAQLSPDEQKLAETFITLGLWYYAGQERAREVIAQPDELVVWLHTTNACNLRCSTCYLRQSSSPNLSCTPSAPAMMTSETGYAAIDAAIRSAQQHGYARILLKYAGGEPLLNLSLVEQLHSYAQTQAAQAGKTVRGVILSNGVMLDAQRARRVQRLGVHMMISLDGVAAVHDRQRYTHQGDGSWAQVWAGIQHAQHAAIPVTISVTVSALSLAGLPALVALLLEHQLPFTLNFYRDHTIHGIDANAALSLLSLPPQQVVTGMRAAYRVIEHNLPPYSVLGCLLDRVHMGITHQRPCGVGESYLVVDTDGGIAKCPMAMGQQVASVWDNDPLAHVQDDRVGVQNPPVGEQGRCGECLWRGWCAGGCPSIAIHSSGEQRSPSPLCGVYRVLVPDIVRLEGIRLLAQHKVKAGNSP
jgi:uncharacterized protein